MANYAAMTKKEIRDVIRTNNKHLRNISIGNVSARFLTAETIRHFRDESNAALDELEKRNPTFEDAQLRQSVYAAYLKAMDAHERHIAAQQYLNLKPGVDPFQQR